MEQQFIVHRKTYITTNLSKTYTFINDGKRDTPKWMFRIRKKK